MSLSKKRRMTEKCRAAQRRNALLSKGPATPEGWERMRKANPRRTSRLSHRLVRRKREERLGGVRQDACESGKVKEKKTVRGDTAEGSGAASRTRYPAIRKS